MQKEAQEAEATKIASTESQEEVNEQVEELNKFASLAEKSLKEEVGEGNYSKEDIMKVAEAMIESEIEEAYEREKVAELYEAGQIMYAGFKAAAEADSAEN